MRAFLVFLDISRFRQLLQHLLFLLQMTFDGPGNQVFRFELSLQWRDLLVHFRLFLVVQSVLTWLCALDEALLVLDVQFCLHFGFIDVLLFLADFQVVFFSLLVGLFFGFSFVFSYFFDFKVQLLLFRSETFELGLLKKFFGNVVSKLLELQLGKLVHQFVVPFDQIFLVILYLSLVALNVWVFL